MRVLGYSKHGFDRVTAHVVRAAARSCLPLLLLLTAWLCAGLSGCATPAGPAAAQSPGIDAEFNAPKAWLTERPKNELPHGGRQTDLAQWWAALGDPLLLRLQALAQQASPSLASAQSRLHQARAGLVAAGGHQRPRLALQDGLARGSAEPGAAPATTRTVLATLSWELDLFGAGAAARTAANARVDAADLDWHEARTLVAVEVAQLYVALRSCHGQLALLDQDQRSRGEVLRLTTLAAAQGFKPRNELLVAQSQWANSRLDVAAQQRDCGRLLALMVELTDVDATRLRSDLAQGRAGLPEIPHFAVSAIPAQTLAQRPDLARCLAELRAAGADLALAKAQRLPQIALVGQFGHARSVQGALVNSARVWSVGPVQVTLPLFDGGRGQAAQDGAQARFQEAEHLLKARVRLAVREVEDALLGLQLARQRTQEAQTLQRAVAQTLAGAQAQRREGLINGFELEEAKRRALQGQASALELQRQDLLQWFALYKALGGGWAQQDKAPAAQQTQQSG